MKKENKKYPFYFYIIAACIPLLFFALVEIFLRIVGYGETIPQWIHPSSHFPEYVVLNQDITRKYFHQIKAMPSASYDGFMEKKAENAFRVFVMGGSTTAGFPFTINGSFARYIRHYLQSKYPDKTIEVINLGISAINSYTLRDLLPGVIEMKPDLLLIYAGHNEYYGALGVGSTEHLSGSRFLVNFFIAAEDYRLVQLLRTIITGLRSFFRTDNADQSRQPLMARMVGEQLIAYRSDLYQAGLDQFAGNLEDMLSMLSEKKIPVVLSTVTANLKDQIPFEAIAADTLGGADAVYSAAQLKYQQGNIHRALDLFVLAKELDALRFRGPEAINTIIKQLGRRFAYPVVAMDSLFKADSPDGICGNNLFVDHVHPTLKGYRQMGRAFIDKLEQTAYLPESPIPFNKEQLQQLAAREMTLTALDSITAVLRINYLKGGWPFIKSLRENRVLLDFQPQNFIERLALNMILNKINWEDAHVRAAVWYRDSGRVDTFKKEMLAILENIPLNPAPFKLLIDGLIQYNRVDDTYPYLLQLDNILPDAYSKKWLGTYYLYKKEYDKALEYLEQSYRLKSNDPQMLYNLAGAYLYNHLYEKALQTIEQCLRINADFPNAQIMRRDLKRVLGRSE